MIVTLTAKLNLHTTPPQFPALRPTQLAYRNALNLVSRYAFAHGNMSNTVGLQVCAYQDVRTRSGLPAQMACSAPWQVGATDTQNHTTFFPGQAARAQADRCARLRKRLQQQGTRSATRLLIGLAGRARRVKHHRNHVISRRLVEAYPQSLSGLGDLTHIRERSKRKHGKKASVNQPLANWHALQWAFAELQGYMAYKAPLSRSMAVKLDAYKTSQARPHCGHTTEANLPERGLLFVCQACQLVLHADLIGARNVALRTLLARQDGASAGVLSQRPDVSAGEARAAQRRRSAALRWSPDRDTSPRAVAGGI